MKASSARGSQEVLQSKRPPKEEPEFRVEDVSVEDALAVLRVQRSTAQSGPWAGIVREVVQTGTAKKVTARDRVQADRVEAGLRQIVRTWRLKGEVLVSRRHQDIYVLRMSSPGDHRTREGQVWLHQTGNR